MVSPDGQIEATVEQFKSGSSSTATITVRFNGRSAKLTFISTENGTEIMADADKIGFSGKNVQIGGSESVRMTGSNVLVSAEDDLLLGASGKATLRTLSGALQIAAAGKLNVGGVDGVNIKSLRAMVVEAIQELKIIATQLKIQATSVTVGQGIFPVARVGIDKVDTTTGMFVTPGSLVMRID